MDRGLWCIQTRHISPTSGPWRRRRKPGGEWRNRWGGAGKATGDKVWGEIYGTRKEDVYLVWEIGGVKQGYGCLWQNKGQKKERRRDWKYRKCKVLKEKQDVIKY